MITLLENDLITTNSMYLFILLFIGILFKLYFNINTTCFSSSSEEKRETKFVCQQPEHHLNKKVISGIKGLGDYVPPWWYNKHLFSLIPFPNNVSLPFKREVHFHSDGSSFVTDIYPNIVDDEKDPKFCLFFPGLASTYQDVSSVA